MILSHVVWGACLGLLHDCLAGQSDDRDRTRTNARLSSPEALAAAAGTGV